MRFYDHYPYNRDFTDDLFNFLESKGMRIDQCIEDSNWLEKIATDDTNSDLPQLDEQLQKKLANLFESLFGQIQLECYVLYPATASGLYFGMWISVDPKSNSYSINLENCTTDIIEESTLLSFYDLCKELFNRYDFRYAALTEEWDGIYFDQDGIPQNSPGILDCYSKTLVDQIGREKLESTPARAIEKLDRGGVMIFLSTSPVSDLRLRQVLGGLEKNIDYVAEESDIYVWTYSISGEEGMISEASDMLLKIGNRIITLADDFFIPDMADFCVKTYDMDRPVTDASYKSEIPYKTIHQDYIIDKGSTSLNLFNGFNTIKTRVDAVKFIDHIEMTGKTLFTLKGKEIFIDTDSALDTYAHTNDWIRDSKLWEPFNIDIGCSESPVDGQNKRPGAIFYNIVLRTGTYIWFDDNEIGEANRRRLENFQKKLQKNFKIIAEVHYRC